MCSPWSERVPWCVPSYSMPPYYSYYYYLFSLWNIKEQIGNTVKTYRYQGEHNGTRGTHYFWLNYSQHKAITLTLPPLMSLHRPTTSVHLRLLHLPQSHPHPRSQRVNSPPQLTLRHRGPPLIPTPLLVILIHLTQQPTIILIASDLILVTDKRLNRSCLLYTSPSPRD